MVYLTFYLGCWYIYRRTHRNIDDTYTSYKSDVAYGMSNVEKNAARVRARKSINSIAARCLISGMLHWRTSYLFPLVLSILTDMCAVVDNPEFKDVLEGIPPKKPEGIPRSPSGRLM